MKPGFHPDLVKNRTGDGRNCDLLEWLYFTDSRGGQYRTKTSTDGGSTPWWLWWFIPPFGKAYWKSFVLHDGCFRDKIQKLYKGKWLDWTPTEGESNWLINDALDIQKAWKIKRWLIVFFLGRFGWRSFNDDRKTL